MPAPTFPGLPEFCYAVKPDDQSIILVKRGEKGYWPSKEDTIGDGAVARCAELNKGLGVTPAQAEAMFVGSLFGWNCPGADPSRYDENGKAKPGPARSENEEELEPSEEVIDFLNNEISNERQGGVTPATLESAKDSYDQIGRGLVADQQGFDEDDDGDEEQIDLACQKVSDDLEALIEKHGGEALVRDILDEYED